MTSKEILNELWQILGKEGLSALCKLPKYCQKNLLDRLKKSEIDYKDRIFQLIDGENIKEVSFEELMKIIDDINAKKISIPNSIIKRIK